MHMDHALRGSFLPTRHSISFFPSSSKRAS